MSSYSNIPKSILSSPSQVDKSDDVNTIRNAAKLNEIVNLNSVVNTQEMHQSRMKGLRKELQYLKETEWKYQPIDKYIGQNM